jgi:PPIC-type PPIASE domain/SurA N-terminal domain
MFGTIRRHQTWLWVIIITLTVVSFLFFGPMNTKVGNALRGDKGGFGTIDGKAISQEQYVNADREVFLRYLVMNGQWPDNDPNARRMGWNEQKEIYQRLFLISKQEQLGIHPSTEAVAHHAHEMLGSGASLDAFVDKTLRAKGMTAADFERFVRHELGRQQLVSLAGLNGKMVTPQEAEDLYRREHQDLSASMVYFSASNYMAGVTVKPEDLEKFYNDHKANYRTPDRVQVNYVKFNLTNYMAEAQSKLTNLTQEVEAVYKQYGTNAMAGSKTPEEAKAKIKDGIIRQTALMSARRAAGEFAEELDKVEPKTAASLGELAKKKGLTVGVSAPFDQQEGPQDLNVSEAFSRSAFALSNEDPIAGPIQANDGWYVMSLNRKIPSEIPPLKSIEAKVTADYRFYQGLMQAQQAGRNFANTLANGLAQGKSFSAITSEAKVKPEALPPFSLSTRSLPQEIEDRINFAKLKQVAFNTADGKASPFTTTRDGGLVLYVQSHLPIDEAKLKKELPDFLAYIRQMRQNDAFNQWFTEQLKRDPAFFQTLRQAVEGPQMKGAANSSSPKS